MEIDIKVALSDLNNCLLDKGRSVNNGIIILQRILQSAIILEYLEEDSEKTIFDFPLSREEEAFFSFCSGNIDNFKDVMHYSTRTEVSEAFVKNNKLYFSVKN